MALRKLIHAQQQRKATLLQLLPSLSAGGVERGTIDIAIAAAEAGYRSLVASSGGDMVRHLDQVGIEHITLPLDTKNPLTIHANIRRIERIVAEYHVDILHARSRAPAWSAYYAALHTKKHFITTFHGTYGLEGWFKKEYNSVMTRGERVIAISDFIAQHIRENYDADPSHIVTIPRGVDFESFAPEKVSEQRLMRIIHYLKIPSELPLILVPGRITRWKGQDFLLRSLAKLPHRHFFCVLLGDDKRHPEYRSDLEALIRELGLVGNVRIIPHTYDMPAAYFLASLVVSPSLEPEAFGRVAIEAQAMGKPVIATAHGGSLETVLHNETGWLTPPGDEAEMAETIRKALDMLHNRTRQKEMAAAAIEHVRRHYGLEAMKKATLAVYEDVLSGPSNLKKPAKKRKAPAKEKAPKQRKKLGGKLLKGRKKAAKAA